MPWEQIKTQTRMKYVAGFQTSVLSPFAIFAAFSALRLIRSSFRRGFGVIIRQKDGRMMTGSFSVQS